MSSTAFGGFARVAPGLPPSTPHVVGTFGIFDTADGGIFRIAGTVAIDGTPASPVRRRVRLFQRLTGRLVREVWSGTDGTFSFTRIAAGQYLVIADDYTGTYEAVAADQVQAVV